MQTIKHSTGFTLIELMITIGVLGALTAIAIPAYTGYIEGTRNSAIVANINTLARFEETYFYENETYLAGTYTPGANGLAALDWEPSGDKDLYNYTVAAGGCAGGITACYTVTAFLIANPAISQTISRP